TRFTSLTSLDWLRDSDEPLVQRDV
ncbi:hypothetical protein SEEE7927_22768, partial [Salmonella enterica subsp. enterica serovar Enteritidis str. 17927]